MTLVLQTKSLWKQEGRLSCEGIRMVFVSLIKDLPGMDRGFRCVSWVLLQVLEPAWAPRSPEVSSMGGIFIQRLVFQKVPRGTSF